MSESFGDGSGRPVWRLTGHCARTSNELNLVSELPLRFDRPRAVHKRCSGESRLSEPIVGMRISHERDDAVVQLKWKCTLVQNCHGISCLTGEISELHDLLVGVASQQRSLSCREMNVK